MQKISPIVYYVSIVTVVSLLSIFYLKSRERAAEAMMRPIYINEKHKAIYKYLNCTQTYPNGTISDNQAYEAIRHMAEEMKVVEDTRKCRIMEYGKETGLQYLCDVAPSPSCRFLSFGVGSEYSFDTNLSATANCRGVGFDPFLINHNAKLSNDFWFVAMGANTLFPMSSQNYITASIPALLRWLNWDHLDVLKLDCAGCEFALARDIMLDDPAFLEKVDQLSVRFHITKAYANTDDHLINMGKLFILLRGAGLQLIETNTHGCTHEKEFVGCHAKLAELGYQCASNQVCQNFLFAKPHRLPTTLDGITLHTEE